MQHAAMGLTCKEAFTVFSQNETLRLQTRVSELEKQLMTIQRQYLKQLERIEWAADVMWKHGIRCGCYRGGCHFCNEPADTCTCQIRNCQCEECKDDMHDDSVDLCDAGLIPEWYHPKHYSLVKAFGCAEICCDSGRIPYCGFQFCDPNWYLTHNIVRCHHNGWRFDPFDFSVVDISTPELLETFQCGTLEEKRNCMKLSNPGILRLIEENHKEQRKSDGSCS